MPSLIQKHAHVKGQRSNHHIFKFQPNPSWAKKRPNRYTSFMSDIEYSVITSDVMKSFDCIIKICFDPAVKKQGARSFSPRR